MHRINQNAKIGMYWVGVTTGASLIAAPFTSIWVPIIFIGCHISILVILTLVNIALHRFTTNPLIKAFEQLDKAISWLGNVPLP